MTASKKIMLVAGESSGDLHASHLAQALRSEHPGVTLFGLGGEAMKAAGVRLLADPTQLAVVGFFEVLRHLGQFRRLLALAEQALEEEKPDLVLLVDYPGFNLRFAEAVKRRGLRLVYYISPQIWAWDPGRIHRIKRLVNRMLVVFPFEKALYERHGVPVTFVGHPLLDRVHATLSRREALEREGLGDGMPVVGLLPGSRELEIRRILPVLLAAGERMQQRLPQTVRFLLLKAPHLPWEIYRRHLERSALNPKVIERWDHNALSACDLVLVASGTATLECALLRLPMVIVYKTSWPTYLVSRLLIRIPSIGLVNVVARHNTVGACLPSASGGRQGQAQKAIVPELLQHKANPAAIAEAALALWNSRQRRDAMKEELLKLRHTLGEPGASRRAAQAVWEELSRPAPTEGIHEGFDLRRRRPGIT